MRNESKIILIAFAALIVYIIYLQSCGKGSKEKHTNTIETKYVYDTIPKLFPVYYPQPKYVELPNETIKIPYTDTNYCKQLALDYLSTRYYADTLSDDSIDVYNYAVVTNNKIVKSQQGYKIKFPVQVTNIIAENRVKFYLGGNIGSDFKQQLYFGPTITLSDKQDHLYHIGANFSPLGGPPVYTFGMDFKLKFKRK